MDESEDNGEVSSSQSCLPPGTPVCLKGIILMEMENALVLNVDWKGRSLSGALIKVEDSESWGPQRLKKYTPVPKKKKVLNATLKKSNSFGESSKKSGPKRRGVYASKYPYSFLDISNIVESKLRYGRDKKEAVYNSCPSSPRTLETKTDELNGSSSGSRAVVVDFFNLTRSTTFSLNKCSGQSQQAVPISPEQSVQGNRSNQSEGEEETQCNEVDSTRFSYNSIEEFDYNSTPKQESTGSVMPLLQKNIYIENCGIESLECPTDGGFEMPPSLLPFETDFSKIRDISATSSSDETGNVSVTSSSTEILQLDSSRMNDFDQGTESMSVSSIYPPCDSYEEMANSGITSVLKTDGESEKTDDNDSEKTYTTLEPCDINYLQLTSPTVIGNQVFSSSSSSRFRYTPFQAQEETENDGFLQPNP